MPRLRVPHDIHLGISQLSSQPLEPLKAGQVTTSQLSLAYTQAVFHRSKEHEKQSLSAPLAN